MKSENNYIYFHFEKTSHQNGNKIDFEPIQLMIVQTENHIL